MHIQIQALTIEPAIMLHNCVDCLYQILDEFGYIGCQSALNLDPLSASNIDPSCGGEEVVPVVHRGDPRGFV